MADPFVFVNLQPTRVYVQNEKGQTVAVFPWEDREKGGATYEVSGEFYARYLAPFGPLSPKPENVKPFRRLDLPKLDPAQYANPGTLLPPELAKAMQKSSVELTGDPTKLQAPKAADRVVPAEKSTSDGDERGLGIPQEAEVVGVAKTLEDVAGPLTEALRANAIETLSDLAESTVEDLVTIPGVTETTAEFLMKTAQLSFPPKSNKLTKRGMSKSKA